MYKDLKGKTALITGSGKRSGIGFAITEKLAACGSNVIIADLGHNPEEALGVKAGTMDEMESISAGLKDAYGVETLAVELDVMSTDSINRMMETIKAQFNRVDLLFNNAGAVFGAPNQVHDYDEDAWIRTVDINLHGVFRVSKAVVPLMLGKTGAIVNMASKAGKSPPPVESGLCGGQSRSGYAHQGHGQRSCLARYSCKCHLPGTDHDGFAAVAHPDGSRCIRNVLRRGQRSSGEDSTHGKAG